MRDRVEVRRGTLSLMILTTLQAMGRQHGYGIVRRIEQTSGGALTINYGTVYPMLLKLEQEGWIAAEWGESENGRSAKFYELTRAGRRQLARETHAWYESAKLLERFLAPEKP
jgi:transcriptional regulator